MKSSHNGNRIDTTLGELIATISDVAFEYSYDTKEVYHLTRLVLVEILKVKSLTGTFPRVHPCINLLISAGRFPAAQFNAPFPHTTV